LSILYNKLQLDTHFKVFYTLHVFARLPHTTGRRVFSTSKTNRHNIAEIFFESGVKHHKPLLYNKLQHLILIVAYYIIMAYEEIDQKFSGKWKVDRSENFEAFLQEVGMYMQYSGFLHQ
jgi:hypothetical protein